MTKPTFLIAAPKSNSGKTLITLGLIQTLSEQGLKVQPFKCGPDYIDPMHHSEIAGRSSYNLDLWMSSEKHVRSVFQRQMHDADVGIIEGVMGLFDGARKDEGSSAAIARLLDVPVVLVVDASSVAFSVAPLLYGFKHFDSRVRLAGVIFNKVAGASHYSFLCEGADAAGVPALGYVPRDKALTIEDRHLGLHLPGESGGAEIVKRASGLIREYVNLEELMRQSSVEMPMKCPTPLVENRNLTIGVAYDQAFNFTYQANLDTLQKLGSVQFFSPLEDRKVPDVDLIWLSGGYPELHGRQLSRNRTMLDSIRNHARSGRAIVAECGGMMYLGKSILVRDGAACDMAGLFDFSTSFENMKLHLGYREVSGGELVFRGHEFHYSKLLDAGESANYHVKTAREKEIEMPVFRYKNVWASYLHLYLGEPEKMKSFLNHLLER
jgi:cobyrinic acid a,c-diamide synthase